jgi:hypothetical protein
LSVPARLRRPLSYRMRSLLACAVGGFGFRSFVFRPFPWLRRQAHVGGLVRATPAVGCLRPSFASCRLQRSYGPPSPSKLRSRTRRQFQCFRRRTRAVSDSSPSSRRSPVPTGSALPSRAAQLQLRFDFDAMKEDALCPYPSILRAPCFLPACGHIPCIHIRH